ncbi:MAG TPA: hypothetical protein V6D48_05855 [Oculatellaceae cyanobacterium]
MADKKVLLVRFYSETDADLIAWLESLAAGQGNDKIKAMLRAGILASQSDKDKVHPAQSMTSASIATLDPASLESVLESILPRIREVVDASLASAYITRVSSETALQDDNRASADLLKGHLLCEDEGE